MLAKLQKLLLGLNIAAGVALVSGYPLRRRLFRLITKPSRDQMLSFFDTYQTRPGDVVMLGDSITAGAEWSELFPDVAIKNRGLSADTTQDVLDRLGQVTIGKPSKIFLLIGSNDVRRGVDHDDLLDRYERIIQRIERETPSTKVYIQSVLPRQRRYCERVAALNKAIEALASRRNHRFVNLFPLFSASDGAMDRDFSNDGVHLLGPGYERWRKAIVREVCDD